MSNFAQFKSLVGKALETLKKKDVEAAYSYFADFIEISDASKYLEYLEQHEQTEVAEMIADFIERYEDEEGSDFIDDFDPESEDDDFVDDFEPEATTAEIYYPNGMAQKECFPKQKQGLTQWGYPKAKSVTPRILRQRIAFMKKLCKSIESQGKTLDGRRVKNRDAALRWATWHLAQLEAKA